MNRSADIVLYVGHIARELDVSCALRHLLRRDHGLELAIRSINFEPYATIIAHAPRVVAFPWFNEDQDVAIRKTRKYWPRALYANLAYEQVFQNINKEVKKPHGSFSRDLVFHHAWGEFYREYLLEFGVTDDRIRVNGNPSYGLYLEPYRRYFDDRETVAKEHGLDPVKRWLFIPENYGAAFYPDAYIEQMVKWGAKREEALEYRAFAQRSLSAMCRWLRDAADPARLEIVLRPRPYTRYEAFMQKVSEAIDPLPAGLRVIQKGTVREWILASDWVMTSYSTSLIEAAIAEKPIHMIVPEPIPEFVHNPWYDLVPKVESAEALKNVVAAESTANHGALRAWATREMLPAGDPIANMANWLADLHRIASERQGAAPLTTGRDRLDARLHKLLRDVKALSKGNVDKAVAHDRFGQDEVNARTARWSKVLGL
ncbi:MAG: hypothetical protein KIS66_02105 [Fimbriimonadaceae bacterium]|nr:hypothetical protein [Fimbriimonadaceae bacterium]